MNRVIRLILLFVLFLTSQSGTAAMSMLTEYQYDVNNIILGEKFYDYDTTLNSQLSRLISTAEHTQARSFLAFASDFYVTKRGTTVIGRVKDFQNLKNGEQSLLNRLPDRGSVKANWNQNSGSQVEKAVRQAYRHGKRVKTQGDRALVRGNNIEMWVNTKTKTIETAYPFK